MPMCLRSIRMCSNIQLSRVNHSHQYHWLQGSSRYCIGRILAACRNYEGEAIWAQEPSLLSPGNERSSSCNILADSKHPCALPSGSWIYLQSSDSRADLMRMVSLLIIIVETPYLSPSVCQKSGIPLSATFSLQFIFPTQVSIFVL